MNKIKISIACLALGITWNSSMNAQVGFNNPAPDASSVIDVKATDKGILVPRMNTAQRNAMLVASTQPANGLLVFDTDLNRFYLCYNNGTIKKWLAVNPWVTDDEGGTPTPLKDMYTLVTGNTGVATSSPKSKLAVNGNFAVGSNYAGNNAAPVNGAIIEGNVGIGKNTAATALDVNGTVTATNYALTGSNTNGPVPKGGIIMWSGSIATIPAGWAICDGLNGTPNLRDRFIVGAGTTYAVNAIGGTSTSTLGLNELPAHTHTATVSTDGAHTHGYTSPGSSNNCWCACACTGSGLSNPGVGATTASGGAHTHTVTIGSQGSGAPFTNLPPYYALAFIMKL